MNCPYCGNPSPDGAAFCGNCGAKLEAAGAASVAPAPVAQDVVTAAAAPVASLPAPEPMPEPAPPPASYTMPPPPPYTPSYTAPAPPPKKKSNRTLLIVVAILLLLLCCCCTVGFAIIQISSQLPDFTRELNFVIGTPTPRMFR